MTDHPFPPVMAPSHIESRDLWASKLNAWRPGLRGAPTPHEPPKPAEAIVPEVAPPETPPVPETPQPPPAALETGAPASATSPVAPENVNDLTG